MEYHFTIVPITKGDNISLTVLVKILLKSEHTRLLHLIVGCTQDCNEIIHENDVGEEYVEYGHN